MCVSRVFTTLILLLSFVRASAAGAIDDAVAAYDKGEYATALRLLRPLAEQGAPLAESILGLAYTEGKGVPQNHAEAARWYRKAADKGFAPAQNSLGWAYFKGLGVPQNFAQATEWFRQAAIQGYPDAEFPLGLAYNNGLGVPQDYPKAVTWFQKAGLHGDVRAQWFVAIAYHTGRGLPQNYAEAAKWYRKGADQGNAPAQGGLGVLYADGRGVPKDYVLAYMWLTLSVAQSDDQMPDLQGVNSKLARLRDSLARRMTPEQIAEAQRLAREWRPRSAQIARGNSETSPTSIASIPNSSSQIKVPVKMDGSLFVVPVELNGAIRLDFAIDSGASDVSVPFDVFTTLKRTGTIKDSDLLASQTYVLADGSKSKSARFKIRSLKVGDAVLMDVAASVSPSQGMLLLGQSFLSRFKSWSIDNANHELHLEHRLKN